MNNSYYLFTTATKPSYELSVCQCGWQNCDPGYSYGPSTRDYYLVHYIVEGKGKFKNAFGEFSISAGDGFLISPGESTTYVADFTDPWRYLWVGFVGGECKNILDLCGLNGQSPVFHQETGGNLHEYLKKIVYSDKNGPAVFHYCLGFLYLILSELINVQTVKLRDKKTEVLNSAIRYIEINYNCDLTVSALADALYIDRSHLFRLFKQNLNMSPIQYIQSVKLNKSCELLRNTNLTITQIASFVGFTDSSSFCKLFRLKYRVTPLKYRKLPFETE